MHSDEVIDSVVAPEAGAVILMVTINIEER